ncbi:MAG: glycerate kinase family protein [Opitutaceae bacterium]
MPRRVLIAFDKFKDALSAQRASAITAREIRQLHPDWEIDIAPLTDGGEGFCQILTEATRGTLESVTASGPRMETRQARIGIVDTGSLPPRARNLLFKPETETPAKLAVVEMAAATGLALVPQADRDPWHVSSYGTGQLIRAASELGAGAILLGVGGSATIDLGLGALAALGLEFRTASGERVRPPFPASWDRISQVEGEIFSAISPIAIACDVTNPLLGPSGAAAVYGPQKGLRPNDLPQLESLGERMASLLCGHFEKDLAASTSAPGAGAAGGISFGLTVATGASLVPGFELVSAWLDLDARIDAADLVITGEGRFDRSSLSGKGPGAIVQRARERDRQTLIFAGAVEADKADLSETGEIYSVTPSGTPLSEALAHADEFLAAAIAGHFS